MSTKDEIRAALEAHRNRGLMDDPDRVGFTVKCSCGWTGKVHTLPPNPVDGLTDPCPTPGYAGRHTAVGAGAVSPPYRCHGCGTWFTLGDSEDDA